MGDALHAVTVDRSAVETFDLWIRFESAPRGRSCLGRADRCIRTGRWPQPADIDGVRDVTHDDGIRHRVDDARRAHTRVGCSSGTVWFVPEGEQCLVVMQASLGPHVADDLARFSAFVERETLDDTLELMMDAVVRDQRDRRDC